MADIQVAGTMKRGETFAVDIALTNKDGTPATLDLSASPAVVSSEIRRKNNAVLATATVSEPQRRELIACLIQVLLPTGR